VVALKWVRIHSKHTAPPSFSRDRRIKMERNWQKWLHFGRRFWWTKVEAQTNLKALHLFSGWECSVNAPHSWFLDEEYSYYRTKRVDDWMYNRKITKAATTFDLQIIILNWYELKRVQSKVWWEIEMHSYNTV